MFYDYFSLIICGSFIKGICCPRKLEDQFIFGQSRSRNPLFCFSFTFHSLCAKEKRKRMKGEKVEPYLESFFCFIKTYMRLAFALFHTYSLIRTHAPTLSLSLFHSHRSTHSLSLTHTHSHTRAHTLFL